LTGFEQFSVFPYKKKGAPGQDPEAPFCLHAATTIGGASLPLAWVYLLK
jgi:hypothetical protein